jgi:uncharacterized protein (DUF433 family)
VVGLRTIALLRNTHRVPLQELRLVASWLSEHPADACSTLTFYVVGRRVYFDDPATGARLAARRRGQTVLPIEMQRVVQETRLDAARLRERTADQIGKIERHRYVVHNAPVIAGTRIPTAAVWNLHAAGFDAEAIIREYPRLTPDDVQAALAFETQRRRRKAS